MMYENSRIDKSAGVFGESNTRLRVVATWSSARTRSKQNRSRPPELTLSAHQQNTALSFYNYFEKETKPTLSTAGWRRSAQPFFNGIYNIILLSKTTQLIIERL